MKAIGIDFGEARIGIAVSDDVGITAKPFKTINCDFEEPESCIPDLVKIIKKQKAEVVVIGLPLHMDGSEGLSSDRVESWAEVLGEELGDMQIELVDERLSTKEAESKLKKAGKSKAQIEKMIDQAAAAEILLDFLEAQQPGPGLEEDDSKGPDPSLAAFMDDDSDNWDDDEEDDPWGEEGEDEEEDESWGEEE